LRQVPPQSLTTQSGRYIFGQYDARYDNPRDKRKSAIGFDFHCSNSDSDSDFLQTETILKGLLTSQTRFDCLPFLVCVAPAKRALKIMGIISVTLRDSLNALAKRLAGIFNPCERTVG
jgi:hypothetical protein